MPLVAPTTTDPRTIIPPLDWYSAEARRFSAGVDRAVLYVNDIGVPWVGLVSVEVSGSSGTVEKKYFDGVLKTVTPPIKDYVANLTAFTYPDMFEQCIGNSTVGNSKLTITGQYPKPFSLTYRTRLGDGLGSDDDYVLHFVYDAMAVESGHTYSTHQQNVELEPFSFELHGTPRLVNNHVPSAYIKVSTRTTPRQYIDVLEEYIYGAGSVSPVLPSPNELLAFLP